MNSLSAKNPFLKTQMSFSGEKLAPYLFILPSMLFLGAILGFPILYSVVISFQKYNLETLISKNAQFVGFQNYVAVLSNPTFAVALTHSFNLYLFLDPFSIHDWAGISNFA